MGLVRGPGFKGMFRFVNFLERQRCKSRPVLTAQVGATPSSRHLLTSDGGSIPDSQLLASGEEYTPVASVLRLTTRIEGVWSPLLLRAAEA